MRTMIPALCLLTGCGIDSLAGDWEGELDCFDGGVARLEIEIDDSEGELDYVGDFFLQASVLYDHSDGEQYLLESDWAGTLVLTQELPDGEQPVTLTLSERTPDCRVFRNGNLVGEDCYEDGLPIGYDFVGEITGDWDGLDEIKDASTGYCEGDLER